MLEPREVAKQVWDVGMIYASSYAKKIRFNIGSVATELRNVVVESGMAARLNVSLLRL